MKPGQRAKSLFDEIDASIMHHLKSEELPLMVLAKRCNVSPYTLNQHMDKLIRQNKISKYRQGRVKMIKINLGERINRRTNYYLDKVDCDIINLLRVDGPTNISALSHDIDISRANIYLHLKKLSAANMIETDPDYSGRQVVYKLKGGSWTRVKAILIKNLMSNFEVRK